MNWYYLTDRQERVSVGEEQLAPLAAGGVLRPNTLVWRKGMSGWAVCAEVRPELFSESGAGAGATDARTIEQARALACHAPWMGVFSAAMILAGAVLMAFTAAAAAGWLLGMGWFRELMRQVVPGGEVAAVHGWCGLSAGVLASLSLMVPGSMLAVAAGQVKRAARRGDPSLLAAALRNLGRFFQVSVMGALLLTVLSGVWSLWTWRDRALPKPPDPTADRVEI
jgi:hypothetical protein